MAWKLDDIDFSDYGITVLSALGLLDVPTIVDETHSWLDSNYSVAVRDDNLPIPDRQIELTCLIQADTNVLYKYNISEFYAALMADGVRELTHPYSTNILSVFVVNSIEIQKLTVSTDEHQSGKFILKFLFEGSPAHQTILIYAGVSNTIRVQVNAEKDALIEENLTGDCFVSFSVESNTPIDIRQNDSIIIGISKYIHFDQVDFIKYSTNKYVYKLKFWHQQFTLKNVRVKNLDGFTEFYYNAATPADIVDLIVDNMDGWPQYTSLFHAGNVVSLTAKNHHIQDEDCYSLLKRICDEYDVEFAMRYVSTSIYIDIFERTSNPIYATSEFGGEIIELKYGEGNGLYTLEREIQNKDDLCTVLYAFGGTKNLPFPYDGQRLQCSINPLSQEAAIEDYGIIEKVKNFDDIYPRGVRYVEDYIYLAGETYAAHTENISGVDILYPAYTIEKDCFVVIDTSIGYDINDQLTPTQAKIVFNTGELAGYEFPINRYDAQNFSIYLTAITDETNRTLPQPGETPGTMIPAAGDEYVIININPPVIFVTEAVTELNAAANAYMLENHVLKVNFKCIADPKFIALFMDTFGISFDEAQVGSSFNLTDADYAISGVLYRIIKKITHLYSGEVDLYLSVLSKAKIQGTLTTIKKQVDELQKMADKLKLIEVNTKRTSEQTTGDLAAEILDPAGTFILPEIIPPKAIDPGQLEPATTTVQFSIQDANAGLDEDDPNFIHFGVGKLVCHAQNAADRAAMLKLRDNAVEYDPTVSHDISDQSIEIPNANGHWIYTKVPL